jgi:RNA polymerase sigma factor (sigma-70 family)
MSLKMFPSVALVGRPGPCDAAPGKLRVWDHAECSGAGMHVVPDAPEALGAGSELGQPEPDLFERVYAEHFAFAWRSLRLLGVAEDVVEDAVQDVFAVVSRQLEDFAGRAALRTWIFAIVQRTAANYRRRHRRKSRPLVPLARELVGSDPTPQAHAEAAEVVHVIERFCEALTPDRRALFVLALIEELPGPEVSRALGIPLNTVYSRVRSLRAGLERALSLAEAEHG